MMNAWNPWHGCHKISPGCQNCYMHRRDESVGRDGDVVYKTGSFDLPIRKKRDGSYRLAGGIELFTCGTSDFFLPEADEWRKDAWYFIKQRPDINFLIITKRINRFNISLPDDWGSGYNNVTIAGTAEDQQRADERLPLLLELPIARKVAVCEPILEYIDLAPYLSSGGIDMVVAGGESGMAARECRYEWIASLREQCERHRVRFWFKQTGKYFIKDGKAYNILKKQQHAQARRSGLSYTP